MKQLLVTIALLTAISPLSAAWFSDAPRDEDHTRITGRRRMHLLHGGQSKTERRAEREERIDERREEIRAERGRGERAPRKHYRKKVTRTTTYE